MMTEERKSRPPAHRPMTIAVTSGKGGVGKTSISANLGAALADAGRRVLLVDADLGLANLDIVLGLEPQFTIADLLADTCTIDDVLLRGPGGLTLLPATSGVHELTELGHGQRASLLAAIESIEDRFDTVILDCPAGIGSDVQLFGGVADEILVVATPDPTSLTDAYALMKVLHTERKRQKFRVIASQVTSSQQARKIYKVLSTVTDKYLNLQVDLLGWVPHDEAWRRAVLERRLAYSANPTSDATSQMRALSRRIQNLERATSRARGGVSALLLGENQ
ncbi:MAG: MinD/ParA family protein [Myxococcota bacterium]|nr:MinD/ParA family protein [Myxococcota bacterium]